MFIHNERFRLHLFELQSRTQITEAIHQATKYNMGRRPEASATVTMGGDGLELSMELLFGHSPCLSHAKPCQSKYCKSYHFVLKQKSKLAILSNGTKGEKGLYD